MARFEVIAHYADGAHRRVIDNAVEGFANRYVLDCTREAGARNLAAVLNADPATPYEAGRVFWQELSRGDSAEYGLEFPKSNPFGDEYGSKAARDFRRGFEDAARKDGFTYSRVTGEYCEGGERETDDFTPPSEQREWA